MIELARRRFRDSYQAVIDDAKVRFADRSRIARLHLLHSDLTRAAGSGLCYLLIFAVFLPTRSFPGPRLIVDTDELRVDPVGKILVVYRLGLVGRRAESISGASCCCLIQISAAHAAASTLRVRTRSLKLATRAILLQRGPSS